MAAYVLARWGGVQFGARPRTALFEVATIRLVTRYGQQGMLAHKIDPKTGKPLTKGATFITPDRVFCSWPQMPTRRQIERAKAALPIMTSGA